MGRTHEGRCPLGHLFKQVPGGSDRREEGLERARHLSGQGRSRDGGCAVLQTRERGGGREGGGSLSE